MIPVINVTHVRQRNSTATVTCTIPNYLDVTKKISIGQSITTAELFDLKFPDFDAQWMLIYYPRGQYDFGVASEKCRVYVKMLSCDKNEMRMNINVSIQTSNCSRISDPGKDASEFCCYDNCKSWAGPFEVERIPNLKSKDSLTIKCVFKYISNEYNDKFNSKRTLNEVSYPISSKEPINAAKKTRSALPEGDSENVSEKNVKPSGEERVSKFMYKEPPRSLIFTPEERQEVKEKYKHKPLPLSFGNIDADFFNPRMNSTPSSKLSLQPRTFKSSQCLQVPDIASTDEMGDEGKQTACTDKGEINASGTSSVHEALEDDQDPSLNKRISFFENLAKGEE